MLRLLIALACLAAWMWAYPHVEAIHNSVSERAPVLETIQLEDVEVTSFREDGGLETRIQGKVAKLGKKLADLQIEPARVEFYDAVPNPDPTSLEETPATVLTSKVGRKRKDAKGVERFEFEGNVVGRTRDGRKLYGELLHYMPSSRDLVAPARSTVMTTDTRITGDNLAGNMNLQSGVYRGNVELTHHDRGPGAVRGTKGGTLQVDGDKAEFDLKARKHRISGSVKAVQDTMNLRCDILDVFEQRRTLLAIGSVDAKDGELGITCNQLEYRTDIKRALARGAPKVRQVRAATGEVQELTAREILADTKGQWVKGEGGVRLLTFVPKDGELVQDADIRAQEVEAFYETGRATFKGDGAQRVEIDAPRSKARGGTAVYYRDSRKVYLNVDAEAWELDEKGEVVRRVRGEHILHFLATGKSVVLGGVRGVVEGDR